LQVFDFIIFYYFFVRVQFLPVLEIWLHLNLLILVWTVWMELYLVVYPIWKT
jgi:hypothetical protein